VTIQRNGGNRRERKVTKGMAKVSVQNNWWGTALSTRILADTDPPADFLFLFARSASAGTPSEESSINTNRKFTTRFPVILT